MAEDPNPKCRKESEGSASSSTRSFEMTSRAGSKLWWRKSAKGRRKLVEVPPGRGPTLALPGRSLAAVAPVLRMFVCVCVCVCEWVICLGHVYALWHVTAVSFLVGHTLGACSSISSLCVVGTHYGLR